MKRWHLLIIAVVALSWIATGVFWTVSENRQKAAQDRLAAERSKQMQRDGGRSWRAATATERKEAAASVLAQLEAFKKDDFSRAATYQSTTLRQFTGPTETFRSMIRNRYPAFCSYKKVTFGPANSVGDNYKWVILRVELTAADGQKIPAIYRMIKEEGKYRVDSVRGGSVAGGGPPGGLRRPMGPPGSNFRAGSPPGGQPGGPPPNFSPAPHFPLPPNSSSTAGSPGGDSRLPPGHPALPEPGQSAPPVAA